MDGYWLQQHGLSVSERAKWGITRRGSLCPVRASCQLGSRSERGWQRKGAGKRVCRFFRVTELITLLLEAKEERRLLRYRQQLAKLDLLVLDELGYVPASKAGAELLFDVIARDYERNSIVVTTNLLFETGLRYWGGSG